MQPLKVLRHPTSWGAAALVIASTVALIAAWLYISPPWQKTVVFYTDDAASVHGGDQVRIAGVKVGKVTDLTLESETDRVRVRAHVDDDAFVGDRSQVEVRMLTVVGGYYVSIQSIGTKPLGNKPIPVERVRMPYNLVQTLADATRITDKLDAKPLRESLDQLQNGFTGANEQSLTTIVDAGNSVMSTIDRQRGQLTTILNFSNEYIQGLNHFGDGLRQIVRKVALAEQMLVIYSDQFGESLGIFGEILNQFSPLAYFYQNHRDKFLEKVRDWLERARMWAEQNGAVVRGLREIRNKVERVLDAQNAPPELLATDICMPVPGSPC